MYICYNNYQFYLRYMYKTVQTPSSSKNHFSANYSEQYSSKISQQPLTQKVLLR